MADDDLLERYLEGDVPTVERARAHPGPRRRRRHRVPGGVRLGRHRRRRRPPGRLHLRDRARRPLDRPPVVVRAGDTDAEVKPDPSGQPLAFVFKTIADPYVGQLSLFKVLSGTIRPTTTWSTPHRARRAPPRPVPAAGQGAARRSTEVVGRRHRRGGQAGRHPHRRHARPQGHAGDGRRPSSRPDRRARPSPSGPAPRPTTTSWRPPCTASRTRTRPW